MALTLTDAVSVFDNDKPLVYFTLRREAVKDMSQESLPMKRDDYVNFTSSRHGVCGR